MSVSVIIPTKNRPHDLELAIESLLSQTRLPDELIIVDQTAEKSFTKSIPIPLQYIHNPTFSGACEARNAAMTVAKGNIWLFLDDDVVLEARFIEEILAAYKSDVAGVSGIITNYTKPPLGRLLWDTIFMRGPFHDDRQRVYWQSATLANSKPIRVRQLGSGLMSFRASAIRGVRFDSNSKSGAPGEDLDFCEQIRGNKILVIAPKARLVHKKSPQARSVGHWLSRHVETYYYLHQRHWRYGFWNNVCFAWLRVGYAFAAVLSCIKRRTFDSWSAWREGARTGLERAKKE